MGDFVQYPVSEEQQEEFLNFCTGVKGPRVLYDAFFKEVMNPETAPERLNEFLSLILRTQVKIHMVLPNDSTRLADESSLLITDIVVELKDGSLANVEIQKIGYKFPGERSACYSADLLLRQYKRVRSEKRKKFSYRNIKSVYNIVLFESSPEEFQKFPNHYIHRSEQKKKEAEQVKQELEQQLEKQKSRADKLEERERQKSIQLEEALRRIAELEKR